LLGFAISQNRETPGGTMKVMRADFTPTQWRMMEVLADCEPHSVAELHGCADDELSTAAVVRVHVANLRRKLRPHGNDIIYERRQNTSYYRLIKINKC